jgi:hypothetical protein
MGPVQAVPNISAAKIHGAKMLEDGAAEYRHVSHDILQRRLNLLRPFGRMAAPVGWGDRVGSR